jgi:hypothetical protein
MSHDPLDDVQTSLLRTTFSDAPIVSVHESEYGWTLGLADSTGFAIKRERCGHWTPKVGDVVQTECVQLSLIVGVRVNGRWVYRWTDEEVEADRAAWREAMTKEKAERLERERYELSQREAALPDWAMRRMRRFHDAGGHAFELDGWGYELHICELAAAMVANDAKAIQRHEEQASGNTYACAQMLAKMVKEGREDEAATGVPAGLAPLTGSVDYS